MGPKYELPIHDSELAGKRHAANLRAQVQVMGERPAVQEKDMKDWAGGAKRSKAMPPWNMQPWKALKGVLTRFTIGMKYGINNWKKALSVGFGMDKDAMRAEWHKGEPGPGLGAEDNSALGFIRQFAAHGFEHFTNAASLADKPVGAVSEKGDDFMANLYAFGWNTLCLIEYAIENEDMVREALSQYPVGSPFHRQDLQPQPEEGISCNIGAELGAMGEAGLGECRKWPADMESVVGKGYGCESKAHNISGPADATWKVPYATHKVGPWYVCDEHKHELR